MSSKNLTLEELEAMSYDDIALIILNESVISAKPIILFSFVLGVRRIFILLLFNLPINTLLLLLFNMVLTTIL